MILSQTNHYIVPNQSLHCPKPNPYIVPNQILTLSRTKNIDDRNCLKPVYGKYVLSQLVSEVNIFSQISKTEGVIHLEEGDKLIED